MSLPGTTVELLDSPQARSAPTDSGVLFVAGLAEKGPLGAEAVDSISEYVTKFGARTSPGVPLYDYIDAAMRVGVAHVVVSRVVGPSPVLATRNLLDGSAAVALTVNAKSYGTWGNSLKVEVQHPTGTTFRLLITLNDVLVEDTGTLNQTSDAVDWSTGSSYVDIVQGASTLDPAVLAASALSGGTDDNGNATNTQYAAALARIPRDSGPGQVAMPARTTDQAHLDLLAHAASHNRFALLDGPDTATAATLIASAVAARNNGRWGAMFAPWAKVPGIVKGTTRTIPWSAIQAGIIARNDRRFSANVPSAGIPRGVSTYATGLSQAAWSDVDREALNDAGVNVAIPKFGGLVTYGYRTLTDPDTDTNYIWAGNMRLLMEITALADVIAEGYLFAVIDGAGHLFGEFQGDLVGMLKPFYDSDDLFGATPDEAFFVDVGDQVNTPATIQAGELHAVLDLRISGMAERVVIEIVKKSTTEGVI